jgi:hypothetical protein
MRNIVRFFIIFIILFNVLFIGCLSNVKYRVNITKFVNLNNNSIPPNYVDIYKVNTMSKEDVIEEIKNANTLKTYYYRNAGISFEYLENNFYIVFENLVTSKKQYNINELIDKIYSLKLHEVTVECPYEYIVIFEINNNIGYMFFDEYRLLYESENGNIIGVIQ